ncbi:MAG: zinc ribbon domain-containing protein [Candidatus Thorarchaeota archaeon]|jgi:transposase
MGVNSTDSETGQKFILFRRNAMARSQGATISVKIPINWESMTERSRKRLRQIVGRDTRVIRAFLGIIEQHENELLTGRKKNRIHDGKIDKLTMTALRVKAGYKPRTSVPHDFKTRFPRISQNEMTECRQTAVALYESYLKLRAKKGMNTSRPTSINRSRRIPRWHFSQRFKLFEKKTIVSRWWLDIRDSLDSVQEKRTFHDRLNVPLKMSPFHLNQIRRGEVKAVQIFTDRFRKWWATIAIRCALEDSLKKDLPVAILGIDLGIEKAACSTLLTPKKTRETRYFVQQQKVKVIKKYDGLVADLQRRMHNQRNDGLPYDKIAERLRQMKTKRENVAHEYDRVLIRQILDYISDLSKKYTVYVAIGRLKNIRIRARRGNYKGRRFRRMIHSWAFARITDSLKHGLAQQGWEVDGKDTRFRAVPEAWTSIMCWKCGSKGTRPKQNYFRCPSCGHKTNADRNGSINIAARMLMLTKSLHSVRGLGMWTRVLDKTRRARLKARKKNSSQGKSLLSSKDSTSNLGESAAVHFVQSDLASFSDGANKSDDDPVVVSTVETLSVVESDDSTSIQKKEARSSGGIPSQ